MKMPGKVNNELYEIYGDTWWDDEAEFSLAGLRYCVNPVRYNYFKRILQLLGISSGKDVLDVGCGGGFLAEEFARDGFRVTGIDPSAKSVAAARKHAVESGLDIRYEIGRGEEAPFPDGSFDLVACCDVLEHVDDLEKVIGEVSRLLKPGGVFFYDTINRTWLSKIALIKVWQEWSFTRCCPANAHVWEKFIKPAELVAIMRDRGLVHREMKGIAPRKRSFLRMLRIFRAIKGGKMSNEEMAAAIQLVEAEDMSMSYMGYAIRQPQ
jgi:2-polyprenyl-6-hydroxyphenyl methylase/3-demethylubiquinone-9 3-methyltransferase